MNAFFLPDWDNLLQIVITAPLMYVFVIGCVRVMGIRSTSQMNSFDWIVTVAIGAIFASTVILKDTMLLEGMFSILLLLLLQYLLTTIVTSFSSTRKVLKATPQLLFFKGEFLEDNMRSERIIRSEIFAVIRRNGYKSTDDIYAIVLETNALISVIPNENDDKLGFSLADVNGLPDGLKKDLEARGEEE